MTPLSLASRKLLRELHPLTHSPNPRLAHATALMYLSALLVRDVVKRPRGPQYARRLDSLRELLNNPKTP